MLSNCAQDGDTPLQLSLAPEVCQPLAREADREGTTIERYCQAVLTREARRLEYVERSRPRVIEGRIESPLLSRDRRAKELGKVLMEVYDRLEAQQGGLTPAQQSQCEEVSRAAKVGDLETLERFEKSQPWRKKWQGKDQS